MKERPIIFSAPMVRALLDGKKTQTRRIIKPQPDHRLWVGFPHSGITGRSLDLLAGSCPYGQPGDRLWVREAWQIADWTDCGDPCIRYTADQAERWPDLPMEAADWAQNQWAALSDPGNLAIDGRAADRRRRHGMFMPRWASRITLEITDVRVERLQDISEADAIAEGIDGAFVEGGRYWRNYSLSDAEAMCAPMLNFPTESYRTLWESINGPGSWDANPWVWVIEFKMEQQEQA